MSSGPSAPGEGNATARRLLVGARLRRLREAQGLTREEAGAVIRASGSKLSRLELGRVSFKERDVADLLVRYGVTDPAVREALLRLVREANRPGWWRAYEDVIPGWFQNYVGLEEAATHIRTYEVQFIPGLLQTPDYARAVIASAAPQPTTAEVERSVALRGVRQRVLTRQHPALVSAVVDEAALRRPAGDADVTRAQLTHLLELAGAEHVTLQILPLCRGHHPPAGGAFSLLRFADCELAEVVYVEQLFGALYLDKAEQVDRYGEVMTRLAAESLTAAETVDFLLALRADT
jgi:transcriptional regulator with XRE-family HTH domain